MDQNDNKITDMYLLVLDYNSIYFDFDYYILDIGPIKTYNIIILKCLILFFLN